MLECMPVSEFPEKALPLGVRLLVLDGPPE
jgi:hypothetical protein